MIDISPFDSHRGRGYWKFNNRVLHEIEFINLIRNSLVKLIKQRITSNPQEKWEAIKIDINLKAQEYCRERALNRNLIINQLEEYLEKIQEKGLDNLSEGETQILNRTQDDLDMYRDEQVQSILFRSKLKWHNDGQKASKYLCGLEKSKSGAKDMKMLITDSGEEITNTKEILKKQRKYYEKLYTAEETETFEYKNDDKRYVLPEIKSAMEGLITKQEIVKALKDMPRNKTPGLDGLTPELFIVFFEQIGDVLTEAINYAFSETGTLHCSALRGVINLIPKKNRDSRRLDHLRPITLLCTDYKLVEKYWLIG